MTITPLVTCEDIRLSLNGTFSGSGDGNSGSYWFWGKEISSGSVLSQIKLANYTLYGILGKTTMETTSASDETIYYHLQTAELDYSIFRVLCNLSGNVIIDGFGFSAGIEVNPSHLVEGYENLIRDYRDAAMYHVNLIQPVLWIDETTQPDYDSTSVAMM
jgi:hypothetical protein